MRFSNAHLGYALVAGAYAAVTCQKGLHIIVARASLEPPGYGIIGALKDRILAKIPNSDSIAVSYPAEVDQAKYAASESEGVRNLTKLITTYGDACPSSKMVLLGYSQGAEVVADTLIGSSYENNPYRPLRKSPTVAQDDPDKKVENPFPVTHSLAAKYRNNIVAAVLMGDPSNIVGAPVNVGTATKYGQFARNNSANWEASGLVDQVVSYCDAGDYFCDSGDSLPVHLGYVTEYGDKALEFVITRALKGLGCKTDDSTTDICTANATVAAEQPNVVIQYVYACPEKNSTSGSGTNTSASVPTASLQASGAERNGRWMGRGLLGLCLIVAALVW